MRLLIAILLLLPSLLFGQIAIGVGVGVPFGGGINATAALITANPANDSVNEAQNVLFSVTATGTPLTYQWQYSVDGTTYADLSDGGKYSGVTTKDLSITGVDYTYHRNYYRAIVTGGKLPPDTSTSALLHVTDSASLKYFARITTAPSDSFKLKVNEFIIAQKDSGLWEKKAVIVLLQNPTAQGAALNMKGDFNNAEFVNSPTFTANDGVTADAGYINSNFNPTTHGGTIYTQDNAGVTIYIKTNIATSSYDFGGAETDTFNKKIALMSRQTSNNRSSLSINDASIVASPNNSVPSSMGIFNLYRYANNDYIAKRNNTRYSTQATESTGLPNLNMFIGTLNVDGSPFPLSGRKYGYYEIGAGLTDDEALINYNQIKTLLGYEP